MEFGRNGIISINRCCQKGMKASRRLRPEGIFPRELLALAFSANSFEQILHSRYPTTYDYHTLEPFRICSTLTFLSARMRPLRILSAFAILGRWIRVDIYIELEMLRCSRLAPSSLISRSSAANFRSLLPKPFVIFIETSSKNEKA